MSNLRCPICKSTNINQFRTPVGKIWCSDCLFSVERKEINNPFIKKIKKKTEIRNERNYIPRVARSY